MRFASIALFVFHALLFPQTGWGQETDDDAPGVEIVTLSEAGVIRDLLFQGHEGIQKLDIFSRGFAPPVEYKGPVRIEFFRIIDGGEGFEDKRQVVGRVDLPPGASRVMLLFKKGESEKADDSESYRIFAFDNDTDRFPAGGYRFFNTSSRPILCQFGDERFALGPDAQRIVTAKGDENGNFALKIFQEREGELKRIYSSVWQVKDTRRTTVFLTPSDTRVQEISVSKFVEPILEEE